ncbi:MAG: Gfo/Idh/MocA family oxidoreductase [Oscillospiraceae bacterium]|nr:Gfo/Idh/MocA family oxidoreductase [Oscillospiraceae bacterium]
MPKSIGYIDYYLDEWHANNYQRFINEAGFGDEFQVTHAYGVIDYPDYGNSKTWVDGKGYQYVPGAKQALSTDEWCAKNDVMRARSIAEVVEKCDYIVVFSPDNTELHEALCQVPLRSGKPIFVDKAFAPDKATAERIFALAQAHNTPLFSSSSLRFSKEMAAIPRQNIEYIGVRGNGDHHDYIIHMLEPLYAIMDAHPTHLMVQSSLKTHIVTFKYADGRLATIQMASGGSAENPFEFGAMVRYMDDNMHVTDFSGFFEGFIPEMLKFFRTGQSPVKAADTIAIASAYGTSKQGILQPGVWLEL